ncbi:OTU domain-containing protein 6B [Xylariaceae sp. FL0016]|nr:OTU domain-containing protein 6B [Xylariaceae sp. FL0016]
MEAETLDAMQARHRREARELQGRLTNKKKNATKKTRKGVNDECLALERKLKERHEQEVAVLAGEGGADSKDGGLVGGVGDRLVDVTLADSKAKVQLPVDLRDEAQPEPTIRTDTKQAPPPQAQAQSEGQGGKKRNRQKERMARRAAEQEAEAEKAEKEAAGMTDHRRIERTYLDREFKANGLVEKEIRPDGHCLFAAVADQLEQRGIALSSSSTATADGAGGEKAPGYKITRRKATEYMSAHADDFAPFLEEDLEAYTAKIRDTAEWGGQLELLALAKTYGVQVKVVQDGRTETIGEADEDDRRIWLAYYRHGYGLGEHYNSLRKAG